MKASRSFLSRSAGGSALDQRRATGASVQFFSLLAVALLILLPSCLAGLPPPNGPGYALDLDGVNDHVDAPDGVWFSGDFTVEGWVYVRGYSNWSRLLDFGNGASLDNVLVALSEGTTGKPHFHVVAGTDVGPGVVTPNPLPLNQWSHLACVLSGTTGTIYVNGLPVASGPLNRPQAVTRTNCYLGRSNYSTDAYANAIFDEVRLWSLARSGAEIQAAMRRQLLGNEGGLVACWRFDEGSGTSAFNLTGSAASTATLVNGPAWVASTITPFAPTVTTLAAGGVTESSTTLNGKVDGRASLSTSFAFFEWGASTNFDNQTPQSFVNPGDPPQNWNFLLSGLNTNTTYYFRAVAQNADGISYGATLTFRPHPPQFAIPATLPDLNLSTSGELRAMAVQPDGKIIIGGHFERVNEVPRTNLARLNPNGSVDLTWNPPAPGLDVLALCIDGTNLFVGGDFSQVGTTFRYGLARLSLADSGSLDPDWNPLVLVLTRPAVRSLAIVGGQLYVGGTFTRIGGLGLTNLARISPQGSGQADPDWAPNPNGDVFSLLSVGQSLFVGGCFTGIGGLNRTNAAKLSTLNAGTADPGWDAKIIQTPLAYLDGVQSMAIESTNLFLGGDFTLVSGVTRTNLVKVDALSGGLDSAWFPTGTVASVQSLALLNGSLFAAGYFGNTVLIKVSASGTAARDSNWKPDAYFTTLGFPRIHFITASEGSIFAGGHVTRFGSDVHLGLAKLDPLSGFADRGFNAQVEYRGFVNGMARQPDGKIIIGGDFYFAGGLPRANIARINRDGTLDATWAPAVNGRVSALVLSSNNVFVGGEFTNISGFSRRFLAKLSTVGKDAVDEFWNPGASGPVDTLAVGGTNLFVGGRFFSVGGQFRVNLAKLSTLGAGDVDPQWNPGVVTKGGYQISALAVSGGDLFVGGYFDSIGGFARTNLAKVSVTGAGAVDPNWNPGLWGANTPTYAAAPEVAAIEIAGTNLFIAGFYTNIGGLPRTGLAKVSALGTGAVDPAWQPQFDPQVPPVLAVAALALDGTNLYAGGTAFDIPTGMSYPHAVFKFSTQDAGIADPDFHIYHDGTLRGLISGPAGLYVAGAFTQMSGDKLDFVRRSSFALMSVPRAPQLIQDTSTNLFLARNASDGTEVTHFRITAVTGGTLFRNDGVTPVSAGDFITVAEGEAGLRFVPGGMVIAVSAVNHTTNGAGRAATSLTMLPNPPPVFKFSSAAYQVREGQDNLVVAVRKYGSGPASVNYVTSDLSATGNLDYQTRQGTLSFSPNDKLKNLVIAIANDLEVEGDEQFAVTLTNASAAAAIAGPAAALVTIADNDIVGVSDSLTTTVSPGAPPPSAGVLAVSLQPANANGQWRLVGELNWHGSGAVISGLVSGNYAVEFLPVDGYFPPAATPITVPVSAGTTNQFTFFYAATATLERGKLTVVIEPGEVASATELNARGQWRRQGGPTNWLNSGELVPDLNTGSYTVEFKPVAGRATPLQQLVRVGGADAIYSSVGTYFFATSPTAATPSVVPFGTATTNAPYLYNGQLQTSVGFGSGFVVKPRVVLTAAHVLFDDHSLSYTADARWFFQRYRDQLEPVPQVPRGWYVFEGYASQRQLDNSPGLSTPASQNLDAAALYFLEDAGRGGYGGYLSSDADSNEYLLSANHKFLAGYPLAGVPMTDQGKLFATTPANLTFTHLYTGIFGTTNIQSFPGNSGGPIYVQADVDKCLPAAICLGGSGQTLVRAINSEVVDLINRAEISGNGGGNIVGGGVTLLSPGLTAPPFGTGLLTVDLTPANLNGFRVGWRVMGNTDTNFFTDSLTTVGLIGGGGYPIEFQAVPGFVTPSNRTVQVAVGQTVTIQAEYVPIRPQLNLSRTTGLNLSGDVGAQYRVESASNLLPPVIWSPLLTITLTNSPVAVSNTLPASTGYRFYRAVLVP